MQTWGIGVTAAGHTKIHPGKPYPPGPHPIDHALTWERGRVLRHYQLVYISEGQGRLESKNAGHRRIVAGTVFLLFPGVWHRYKPAAETGWTEDWLELTGPAMQRLRRRGEIDPKRGIYHIGLRRELIELFDRCHHLARTTPARYQPALGTLGLQILAQVILLGNRKSQEPSAADTAVLKGQRLIADAIGRPLTMESLAEEVGLSYSYFRRAFRCQTGMSAKKYQLQIRLRKAQELLTHTSASVKEIAQSLGYDSAFHLSADFKSRTGFSPSQWRAESRF